MKKETELKEETEKMKSKKHYLEIFLIFTIIINGIFLMISIITWMNFSELSELIKKINIENVEKTEIIFDDSINETEMICINNTLKEINPIYFSKISSITFTKKDVGDFQGINTLGDIIIIVPEDKFRLVNLICHEIMHSYINAEKSVEEQIVDDIVDKGYICYPNIFTSYINDECSFIQKLNQEKEK